MLEEEISEVIGFNTGLNQNRFSQHRSRFEECGTNGEKQRSIFHPCRLVQDPMLCGSIPRYWIRLPLGKIAFNIQLEHSTVAVQLGWQENLTCLSFAVDDPVNISKHRPDRSFTQGYELHLAVCAWSHRHYGWIQLDLFDSDWLPVLSRFYSRKLGLECPTDFLHIQSQPKHSL